MGQDPGHTPTHSLKLVELGNIVALEEGAPSLLVLRSGAK